MADRAKLEKKIIKRLQEKAPDITWQMLPPSQTRPEEIVVKGSFMHPTAGELKANSIVATERLISEIGESNILELASDVAQGFNTDMKRKLNMSREEIIKD